jgi:hypothetical protein
VDVPTKRFGAKQIVTLLRQIEVLMAQGNRVAVGSEKLIRRRFRFWQTKFPVPAYKFPVPLIREFVPNRLRQRRYLGSLACRRPRFCKIPYDQKIETAGKMSSYPIPV